MNSDNIALWETQHNNADWDCFKTLILRETSKTHNEHQVGILMHFRKSKICAKKLWMCKKQTSVSHGSTERELISLDGGLRMDGIPALDLWDLLIAVLHSPPNQINKSKGQETQENCLVTPHST